MKSYTAGISYLGREEWTGTGKAVTFNNRIGEGPTTQEARSAKVTRQALKRLLGEEDNAVSGVPEMFLKRSVLKAWNAMCRN